MSCQDVNKCFEPFLFTKHCTYEGIKRCNDNLTSNQKCELCGPNGSPCADCYLCMSIPCIGCDIITCPWRFTCYTREKYCIKQGDFEEYFTREDNI